jgi:ABC-2 type transport system ATP-binding protein
VAPAVAVGAGEEVLWRAVVLGRLLPVVGVAAALAVSSAAFALTHYPAQGRRGAAVHLLTGAGFGLTFVFVGGIAAAIAAHAAYNLLATSAGAPAAAAVLEARGVAKRLGRVLALAGVDLALRRGEIVALLGPNGAGKTTFVSIVLGLRRPDAGTVRVLGHDPGSRQARLDVAATPQEMSFPPTLRVREIVDFVLAHRPGRGETAEVLSRFRLEDLSARQAGGLSGGQRRRLAVALAFASQPRLAVLDEPTAGLDVETRLWVWDSVRAYAAAGGSVLLTTHHLEEAEELANRIVVLSHGRVVAEGSAEELTAGGDRSLQDAYLLLTGGAA